MDAYRAKKRLWGAVLCGFGLSLLGGNFQGIKP